MRRLFAFLALAVISLPCAAADLGARNLYPEAAPYASDGPRWTGGRIGAGLGLGAVVRENGGDESALGSVEIGGDYQLGRFVLGGFADYRRFDATIGALDLDTAWSGGGRAGYLLTPDTLAYGLAAYTRAYGTRVPSATDYERAGLTLGGGVETRVYGNWFAGVEVRHTELDDGPALDAGLATVSYRFPVR